MLIRITLSILKEAYILPYTANINKAEDIKYCI